MNYWIVAFYSLAPLDDPHGEVAKHKEFFKTRDLVSRIYISEQGINAQMSGLAEHAQEYMDWLRQDVRFRETSFKVHLSKRHAFPKATIKYRKQLVAIDCEVDLNDRGLPIEPAVWKEMLAQRDEHTLVLDVRNDYEWKIGHFEGAELPELETFREFPDYAKRLKRVRDPKKTKVMMYCTGGIRCEFYSAVMKKEGFEQVYQLEGGVIQYGLDEGQSQWEGKLFVFDDRLVIPISGEEALSIAACKYCETPCDVYYNCANMDCNDLFVCCSQCLKQHKGCCLERCQAGRVRPIAEDADPRPFRKWSHEEKMRMC
jgi:UPF0176 protein